MELVIIAEIAVLKDQENGGQNIENGIEKRINYGAPKTNSVA